jgi:predicted patatin/cPLA2 family phospholipase
MKNMEPDSPEQWLADTERSLAEARERHANSTKELELLETQIPKLDNIKSLINQIDNTLALQKAQQRRLEAEKFFTTEEEPNQLGQKMLRTLRGLLEKATSGTEEYNQILEKITATEQRFSLTPTTTEITSDSIDEQALYTEREALTDQYQEIATEIKEKYDVNPEDFLNTNYDS